MAAPLKFNPDWPTLVRAAWLVIAALSLRGDGTA
jgi:hypothetical protein